MKDFTIMHACGLEEYETSKSKAIAVARKHKKECKLEVEPVYIDESLDHELTGNHWKI